MNIISHLLVTYLHVHLVSSYVCWIETTLKRHGTRKGSRSTSAHSRSLHFNRINSGTLSNIGKNSRRSSGRRQQYPNIQSEKKEHEQLIVWSALRAKERKRKLQRQCGKTKTVVLEEVSE